MRIGFIHQPWNRVVHGAPQGSVPIWTDAVSRRLASAHDVYVYSRRFEDQSALEKLGSLRYVRVDAPADPLVARFIAPLTRLVRRKRSPYASRLFYRQYYRRVARDMARRGIEVVHLHSFPQAASIIRREHPSARIVVHLHVEWLNLLPPHVARRQVKDADLIVGCSDYLAEQMRLALPADAARIRTVYNAVDVSRFTPSRDSSGRASHPTVLFVGRLSPEKGIHVLLDAFAQVLTVVPDLRLEIIGHNAVAPMHVFEHLADSAVVASLRRYYDLTAWSRLRTWLRTRYPRRLQRLKDTSYGNVMRADAHERLGDRVRFIGFVANNDLLAHYRRADVVCLPSLTETFGMPLVEAMACGIPTIASRAGGIPEIVEDGVTGLLCPVFDSRELANAIQTLVTDPQRRERMGDAGRRRVVERFSWEAVVTTLVGLYEELLAPVPVPTARELAAASR